MQPTQPMMPPIAPQPTPKRSKKRLIIFIVALAVALITTVLAVATLFKVSGVETNATEEDAQVGITTTGFDPAVITVKKGQNVVWTSQDKEPHGLALTTPNAPSELEGFGGDEQIENGETYSFTFDVAGTFTYHDPQAPEKFQGTIEVKE